VSLVTTIRAFKAQVSLKETFYANGFEYVFQGYHPLSSSIVARFPFFDYLNLGYTRIAMFKPHTVLGLGLWLIAIRFIGIPLAWREGIYVLTGVVLVCIYLKRLWRETVVRLAEDQSHQADTFVQNGHSASSADTVRPG
jgi:hypothetical protein